MTVLTSALIIKLIDAVSAPAKKMSESLKGIGRAAQGLNGTKVSGSMVDNLGKNLEATTRKIDALRSRMLEAAAVGYGLSRALAAPLSTAREFESTLLDIAQKGDLSDAAMAKVGRQVGELAGKLKKSLSQNELAKGVDILAGFGLDADQAMTLLEPIGRAAVAYKSSVEDLAKAGNAALSNLKVPADQFGKALDAMAQAGKEGAFELKDMAREFPSLTAAAEALGMAGVDGVAKLSAALQIARKGAGSGSEAATNTKNMMQKIISPETTKKFKKFGVDIRSEFAKVKKEGGDVFEMIANLVMKATKGDLSKIGDLFEDSQVQQFLLPLIGNLEEYKRIRDKAAGAKGVVDTDFERRLKTGDAALATFKNRLEDLSRSIGAAILPAINAMMGSLGGLVDTFASLAERFPELTATIVGLTAGLVALRVASIAAAFAGLQLKAAWLTAALAGAKFRTAIAAAAALALAPFKAAAIVLLGVLQTMALRFRLAAAAGLAFNRALIVGTLATFTRGLGAAAIGLLALLSPLRLVRGALVLLRGALMASGIGALLVGFGAAATWISKNWSGIGKAFESFKSAFMSSVKPILGDPAVQGLIDVAGKIASAWEAITGKVDEGTMKRFGTEAGEMLGDLTKRVVEFRTELLSTLSLIPGLGFLKPKDDKPADPRDGARRVGPKTQDDRQEPGFDWGEFFTPAPGGDLVGTWATKLRTWLKTALAGLAAELAVEGAKLGVALAEGIGSAAGAIGSSAAGLASRVVDAVSGLVGSLTSTGAQAIAGLADALRTGAASAASWISGLPGQIAGALSGLSSTLQATGSAAMSGLWGGMRSVWTSIVGWASSLAGQIAAAFSNLAGQLTAAGAAAMQGLWDGMKSIGESIVGWASGLAGRIAGTFAGIGSKIRGALGGGAPAPAGGGGAPAVAPAAPAAPARATGGHVKAGHVYRVNDDRTDDPVELFRPNRSGTVLPSSERKKLAGDRATSSDRAPLARIADRLSGIGEGIRTAMSRREPNRSSPGEALNARFERVLGAFRDNLEAGQQPVRYASAPPVATPTVRPAAPIASAPAPAAVPVGPRPLARPEPRQAPAAAPAAPAAAPAAAAGGSFTFNPTFIVNGAADPAAFAREAMTVMKREAERARRTLFSDSGLRTV